MAARTGMVDLIREVRSLTGATAEEYTIDGYEYWDDDRIQDLLDQHRVDVYRDQLQSVETWVGGGTIEWTEYYATVGNLEQVSSGTTIFFIEDGLGANIGTANYTPNYRRGHFTFSSDQGGTTYYLTGRSYNLYATAADLLEQWAGYEARSFDVSTGSRSLFRSQKYINMIELADRYRRMGGNTQSGIERSDLNVIGP